MAFVFNVEFIIATKLILAPLVFIQALFILFLFTLNN